MVCLRKSKLNLPNRKSNQDTLSKRPEMHSRASSRFQSGLYSPIWCTLPFREDHTLPVDRKMDSFPEQTFLRHQKITNSIHLKQKTYVRYQKKNRTKLRQPGDGLVRTDLIDSSLFQNYERKISLMNQT